eukprot:scaffold386_cov281-Prasinococcus_capsulatus_cf.AAC.2
MRPTGAVGTYRSLTPPSCCIFAVRQAPVTASRRMIGRCQHLLLASPLAHTFSRSPLRGLGSSGPYRQRVLACGPTARAASSSRRGPHPPSPAPPWRLNAGRRHKAAHSLSAAPPHLACLQSGLPARASHGNTQSVSRRVARANQPHIQLHSAKQAATPPVLHQCQAYLS